MPAGGSGWRVWGVVSAYLHPARLLGLLRRLLGGAWPPLRAPGGGVGAARRGGGLGCRPLATAAAPGQTLAPRLLHAAPNLSEKYLKQEKLTLCRDYPLWLKSSEHPNSRSTGQSPPEPQCPTGCIAKGMGLVAGVQGRRATFYVYPRHPRIPSEVGVTVQGPSGDFGSATVPLRPGAASRPGSTSTGSSPSCRNSIPVQYRIGSGHVRVTFTPRSCGHHELRVTQDGAHVVGSPFSVHIEKPEHNGKTTPWRSSSEDEDDEKKVSRKRIRVLLRVVDFVGEKMLLTEDGKLQRVCSIEALYRATRKETTSPEGASPEILSESTLDSMTNLLEEPSSTSLDRNDIKLRGARLFRDRCRHVINLCNFVLRNASRQRSLEILKMAENIIDGRPIRIRDDFMDKIKVAVERIVATPVYFSLQRECQASSNEVHKCHDNMNVDGYNRSCVSVVNNGCVFDSSLQQKDNIISIIEESLHTGDEHICMNKSNHASKANNEAASCPHEYTNNMCVSKNDDYKNCGDCGDNSFKFYARLVPTILEEDEELLCNMKDRSFLSPKYEDFRTLAVFYCDGSNQISNIKCGTMSKRVTSSKYEPKSSMTTTVTKNIENIDQDELIRKGDNFCEPLNEKNINFKNSDKCSSEQSTNPVNNVHAESHKYVLDSSSYCSMSKDKIHGLSCHKNFTENNLSCSDKFMWHDLKPKGNNQIDNASCSASCINQVNSLTINGTAHASQDLSNMYKQTTTNKLHPDHCAITIKSISKSDLNLQSISGKKCDDPFRKITDAEVDFDPIISAPNLEEALKKLEEGLQKHQYSPIDLKSSGSNSSHSHYNANNSPDNICVAVHDFGEMHENRPLDIEVQDSPVNYDFQEDDYDNLSYGARDSDYVSLDDVLGSLQQSSEDETRSVSSSQKRYRYGESSRSNANINGWMGPAELEIWGIRDAEENKWLSHNSSYASKRPQTAMPSSRQYSRYISNMTHMTSITEETDDFSSRLRRQDALSSVTSHSLVVYGNQEKILPENSSDIDGGIGQFSMKQEFSMHKDKTVYQDKNHVENTQHNKSIIADSESGESVHVNKEFTKEEECPKIELICRKTVDKRGACVSSSSKFQVENVTSNGSLTNTTSAHSTIYATDHHHSKTERSEIVFSVGSNHVSLKESDTPSNYCNFVNKENKNTQSTKYGLNKETPAYFLRKENNNFTSTLHKSSEDLSAIENIVKADEKPNPLLQEQNTYYSTFNFVEIKPYADEPSNINSNESKPFSNFLIGSEYIKKQKLPEKLCHPDGYESEHAITAKLLCPCKQIESISPKIKRLGKSLQENMNVKHRTRKHPSILVPGIVSRWRRLFENRTQGNNSNQSSVETGWKVSDYFSGSILDNKNTVSHWKTFWEDLLYHRSTVSSTVDIRRKDKMRTTPPNRNIDLNSKSLARKIELIKEKQKVNAQSFFQSCIDETTHERPSLLYSAMYQKKNKVMCQNVTQTGNMSSNIDVSLQQPQASLFNNTENCIVGILNDSFDVQCTESEKQNLKLRTTSSSESSQRNNSTFQKELSIEGDDKQREIQIKADTCVIVNRNERPKFSSSQKIKSKAFAENHPSKDLTLPMKRSVESDVKKGETQSGADMVAYEKRIGRLVLYSSRDQPKQPSLEEYGKVKERFHQARSFFRTLEGSGRGRGPGSLWVVPRGGMWRNNTRPRRKKYGVLASNSDVALGTMDSSSESETGGSERRKKRVSERFHVRDLFRDVTGEQGGSIRGLKGIPNCEAVLAALRSVEDDNGSSRASSPYEALEEDGDERAVPTTSPIPEYQADYPHLPKTPARLYRHRTNLLASGIVPRKELLKAND